MSHILEFDEGKWTFGGKNLATVDGDFKFKFDSPIALMDGAAYLDLPGDGLTIEKIDEKWKLNIPTGVFTLRIRPFIPLNSKNKVETLVTWAFSDFHHLEERRPEIAVTLISESDSSIDLDPLNSNVLLELLFQKLQAIERLTEKLQTAILDLPLLHQDNTSVLSGVTFELGSPKVEWPNLSFVDTKVIINGIGSFNLEGLQIDLQNFAVDVSKLKAPAETDIFIGTGSVGVLPSLILRKGSVVKLGLSAESPSVIIEPPASGSAMLAIIPGIEEADLNEVLIGEKKDRLVFDVFGIDEEKEIQIGPNGLKAVGKLRMKSLELGNEITDCQLTDGNITFNDGLFEAEAKATAKLPYFKNSDGNLSIRASSIGKFSAIWEMATGKSWTDPTGNFIVHNPKATVTISYDQGWKVSGKLGGQLHFVGIEKLEGAAREWLSDIADTLRMQFEDLDLSRLVPNEIIKGVSLDLSGLPGMLDLWKIFQFKPDSFKLFNNGFSMGGLVTLKDIASGLSFQGKLPNLRCLFESGKISLSTVNDDVLRFFGKLTTPGGVSVSLDLSRQINGRVEELLGTGSLIIPSFPPVTVTCALGHRRRKNGDGRDPVFLLFAQADYPIPLYPGVVLRNVGLGVGINKVMKIVDDTSHDQLVNELVNGPVGFPNPAEQSTWTTPARDTFDLSLVANTYIAPSNQGAQNQTFPYVGAATVYARPTTDFVILLGAHLWLMTSLADAETSEFRKNPAATGAMAIFPRHGYIELQVKTKPNPSMTDEVELIKTAMNAVSGELFMKATRDEFLFRVGPFRGQTTIAGIYLSGSVIYATYIGKEGAIAVLQATLEGSFRGAAEAKLRFGPLTVTAGFACEAEVALETVMAGMYLSEKEGLALYQKVKVYVSFSLSVYIRVEFRLVLKFWQFEKTISWSQSHSASLTLSVDLWLEILVAKDPALYGHAKVNVSLFGYDFSPTLQIGENQGFDTARKKLAPILSPNLATKKVEGAVA